MGRPVLAVGVVALCAVLTAAPEARAERPVLLLLHAGGFVFDATEMPYPEEVAKRHGFAPKFVAYPAGDLPGAVHAARSAARDARADGRRVYAYGESAGGLLAAVLAQEDRVAAASTYCPMADLNKFARGYDDPQWYQDYIQASDRDMRRYSPALHDSDLPIFAMRAVNDSKPFNRWIRNWDLRDPEVTGTVVPGQHLGSPNRPSIYRENVRRAIRWLRVP